MKAWIVANNSPPAATATSHMASCIEPTASAIPVRRWRIDKAEVTWKRYQVGNMKGDIGRSMVCCSSVLSFDAVHGAEAAQQPHDIMIVLWRRLAAPQDPVEQIGVGAIEQSLAS